MRFDKRNVKIRWSEANSPYTPQKLSTEDKQECMSYSHLDHICDLQTMCTLPATCYRFLYRVSNCRGSTILCPHEEIVFATIAQLIEYNYSKMSFITLSVFKQNRKVYRLGKSGVSQLSNFLHLSRIQLILYLTMYLSLS